MHSNVIFAITLMWAAYQDDMLSLLFVEFTIAGVSMFDIVHFPLFAVSALALSVTPGPDLAYVVGQSIANGRRAGVVSAAGVAIGSCAHTLASAVGLTALLAASPMLFTLVRFLGAAYLIWLGIRMITRSLQRGGGGAVASVPVPVANTHSLLLKGFLTTITNPKVLLFFIAFFPQFVTVGGDHQVVSFLLLGLAYAVIGFLSDAAFAWLAGSAAGAVSRNQKIRVWIDRVVGTAFIALGLRIWLAKR